MKMLYLNQDTSNLPAVFVWAWIKNEYTKNIKSCLNFATYDDER
jgi:hypothetical protein